MWAFALLMGRSSAVQTALGNMGTSELVTQLGAYQPLVLAVFVGGSADLVRELPHTARGHALEA